MVVTIELGVYIEAWGGVRLEELVLITQEGAEVLTEAPRSIGFSCASFFGGGGGTRV